MRWQSTKRSRYLCRWVDGIAGEDTVAWISDGVPPKSLSPAHTDARFWLGGDVPPMDQLTKSLSVKDWLKNSLSMVTT
jgi:hypothetical protein